MQDIMQMIKIHALSERVYEAITTAHGIRQWWTRDASIEPKVGATEGFGFYAKRIFGVCLEALRGTSLKK